MPLMQSAADALPLIDPPASDEALTAANALIQAELSLENQTVLHSSIPETRESNFSEAVAAEHQRLARGQSKEDGIDLTRYEALDPPEKGNVAEWKVTLQKAYASAEYLRGREINLGLLETYGKNAWLIGNSQLEDILRSLERAVEAIKLEQEGLEQTRRLAQESVAGEMQNLDDSWRKGVGRMIEAQAAAEDLRQEILQRKRMAAA